MSAFVRLALTGALLIPALPAAALDAAEREEVGQIVREYLLKNPELMIEVQQELAKRQEAAEAAKAKAALANKPAALENSRLQAVIGNPKGDVTLVEFFDYNCGYCRKAVEHLNELVKADPKLRVVLKEFPILGQGSIEAAQVSVAVNLVAPEKYRAFHDAMLAGRGQANRARALAVVKEIGLDPAKIEAALSNPDIQAALTESYALAESLGVEATPAFVIGDAIVPGAVGVEPLQARIAAVRDCGKAAC